MFDLHEDADFAENALEFFGFHRGELDHFGGAIIVCWDVAGDVDVAEAAFADLLEDLEVVNNGARDNLVAGWRSLRGHECSNFLC